MSDLARRRDAHDLWVSRSHLHAGLAAATLLALLCFAGGYALGRTKMGASEGQAYASITDGAGGEDLVELLAQVERAAIAHPSAAMAYPAWAESKGNLPVPAPGAPEAGVEALVGPSPVTAVVSADAPPKAKWTVEVAAFEAESDARAVRDHLRARAQPAFMTVRVRDGVRAFWVGVGGFETQAEAKAASTVLAPVVAGSPVSVGVPRAAEVPKVDASAPVVPEAADTDAAEAGAAEPAPEADPNAGITD